jgi:AcrR family transcriptional regulator
MTKPTPSRTNDPERTMRDILAAATREFADKGLSGARIDQISEATQTSKRMIYYYFGSKEGLYVAVLEDAYRRVREREHELHLEDLPAREALARLVRFTLEFHWQNPDFVRLVMTENIHTGRYLALSTTIQQLNTPAIDAVRALYTRGVAEGCFRPGLDPVDLHMSISALSFYNVSNRYSFSFIFKHDISQPEAWTRRADSVVEMVLRFVCREADGPATRLAG